MNAFSPRECPRIQHRPRRDEADADQGFVSRSRIDEHIGHHGNHANDEDDRGDGKEWATVRQLGYLVPMATTEDKDRRNGQGFERRTTECNEVRNHIEWRLLVVARLNPPRITGDRKDEDDRNGRHRHRRRERRFESGVYFSQRGRCHAVSTQGKNSSRADEHVSTQRPERRKHNRSGS